MYCKHCGQKIDDDSRFCSACGKSTGGGGGSVPIVTNKKGKPRVGAEAFFRPLSVLYLFLSLVCCAPMVYAEYRRLIVGVPLDATYWLLISPMFLSVFFLYLVMGVPVIAEEKRKVAEDPTYVGTDLMTLRCEILSFCCIPVAIIAFAASGILRMIF